MCSGEGNVSRECLLNGSWKGYVDYSECEPNLVEELSILIYLIGNVNILISFEYLGISQAMSCLLSHYFLERCFCFPLGKLL